jgi:hypothetical protein
MPGIEEVTVLVGALEDDFWSASWNTRTAFPHLHKESGIRINLGHFKKAPSPLRQEVMSEDVSDPPEIIGPDDPGYEYDWDYVASTDPLHPVDTNYAHPFDNVDPSWMLSHLSSEELEASSDKVGFNANEADTLWADDIEEPGSTNISMNNDITWWDQNETSAISTTPTNEELAWGPEVETPPSRSVARNHDQNYNEQSQKQRIQMIIDEFWKLIHDSESSEPTPQQPPSFPDDDLTTQIHTFQISEPLNNSLNSYSSPLTPPPTPPRVRTDTSTNESIQPPSDFNLAGRTPSQSSMIVQNATSRSPETPTPDSTFTSYNK